MRLDGPDPDAPAYLNAVALIRTTLTPEALLDLLHEIEAGARAGARRTLGRPHARPRHRRLRRAAPRPGRADASAPAGGRARLRAAAVARGRSGCRAGRAGPGRRPARRPRGARRDAHAAVTLVVLARARRGRRRRCCSRCWPRSGSPKLRPEYTLAITLVLIGAAAITLAVPVRRATRGNPAHRVDPFYATRVVVLAKASALGGALLVGRRPRSRPRAGRCAPAPPAPTPTCRVFSVLGGGVALLIGGLVAELLCTVPKDGDDDPDVGPRPRARRVAWSP